MIFEKPDVLYFLFLLIIPVLIHLFQLRKYKITKFSNVALLERLKLQSRKSSIIKKWLILITRLLGLVFLILAFAKPFIPNTETALEEDEIVIYLDNSFSMDLPGKQRSLLEEARQNLWTQLGENQRFSLFTNNQTWKNVTKNDIKDDFFSIDFVPVHLKFDNLLLKAESLFQKRMSGHSLFIISDALNFKENVRLKPRDNLNVNWIIKSPSSLENFTITSAQLESNNTQKRLEAEIQAQAKTEKDRTVSLYDNNQLIAKTKARFEESTVASVSFDLSNSEFKNARLEIEPDGMSYDNTLFFSLNKEKKINVLSLHSRPGPYSSFLGSIYQTDLFNFREYSISNFDYTKISDASLVILNEIQDINPILISRLKEFLKQGGSLVIIPDEFTTQKTFSELTDVQTMYQNSVISKQEVTSINFEHPLLENVFSEKVQNFDYPSTSMVLDIHPGFAPILKFSDDKSFLAERNKTYIFASALNTEVSNFINSPLVVPVFYNIALQSNPAPQLYATIGQENIIQVKARLDQDEVLKLKNKTQQVIPQQTQLGNSVQINTEFQPKKGGYFKLVKKDSTLLHLSFNYDRNESQLNPIDRSALDAKTFSSFPEAFNSFTEERKILELWIWMLIFAIGFFVTELLILRFLN